MRREFVLLVSMCIINTFDLVSMVPSILSILTTKLVVFAATICLLTFCYIRSTAVMWIPLVAFLVVGWIAEVPRVVYTLGAFWLLCFAKRDCDVCVRQSLNDLVVSIAWTTAYLPVTVNDMID
jgi:hypothetical protein